MILISMQDDVTPRNLVERTGRHFCVRCRVEVPADVYFAASTAGRSWKAAILQDEARARAGAPAYAYQVNWK